MIGLFVQVHRSLLGSVLAGLLLGFGTGASHQASSERQPVPEGEKRITVEGQVLTEEDSLPVEGGTVAVYPLFGDSTLGTATAASDGGYVLRFVLPEAVGLPHRFRVEAVADGFVRERVLIRPDTTVVEPVDFALPTADPDRTPVKISSLGQLRKIGERAAYPLDGDYVLTQNIDASETAQLNEGQGFDPIGQNQQPDSLNRFFSGTFNGQGHVIAGLTIDRPEASGVGLFAGVDEGTVRNLTLRDLSVTGEGTVGGLAGKSHSFAAFENCRVEGTVSGWIRVGGLIGVAIYTEIQEGELTGTVGPPSEGEPDQKYTGAYSAATGGLMGGLVGRAAATLIEESRAVVEVPSGHILESVGGLAGNSTYAIRHSQASGSLTLDMGKENVADATAVGGLVGANSGRISASSSSVDVQGHMVGGLVGNNENGRIEQSYASGTVEATDGVGGGLAGMDISGAIVSSYAVGEVSGEEKVGGLIGRSRAGKIRSSLAVGAISSEDSKTAGGILGEDWGGTEIAASYWDREMSGQDEAIGETFRSTSGRQQTPPRGLSTTEMIGKKARRNLDGLDFEAVWRVESDAYPSLRWESR
jgi:hypothetical protein